MSIKNTNDTAGNQARNLPARGAVRQPTAPSSVPPYALSHHYLYYIWEWPEVPEKNHEYP